MIGELRELVRTPDDDPDSESKLLLVVAEVPYHQNLTEFNLYLCLENGEERLYSSRFIEMNSRKIG